MNTTPKVICISACETGIGVHEYGAGVFSLSRSFIDNGGEAVISTLWKINEKATKEFMVLFYENWNSGLRLYDAIKRTQESFKHHKKYSHPYYWAGFVLEGNPTITLK